MKTLKRILSNLPTPICGLALGIASLGWCWDNFDFLSGQGQFVGAMISSFILLAILFKFVKQPKLLIDDLKHPVVGSVVPTFAMCLMVISNAVGKVSLYIGDALWLFSVLIHVLFLITFVYHRAKEFSLHHMVPSWFVPPVGLIVADVAFSGSTILEPIAIITLNFGLLMYAILLPLMIYRILFCHQIPDDAKPTIAILAAPASLSLAGYLTVIENPSPVVIAILMGIALLMTLVIYMSFFHLLRLPFSYGYAAFTFPMVIGATALFKIADWMQYINMKSQYVNQIHNLACFELLIATGIVIYVASRYVYSFYEVKEV
jgi:tellurite resistance protein TehA-like permease